MKPETALQIVEDIRRCLKGGATIKAIDKDGVILEEQPNGIVHGGLYIEYPKYENKEPSLEFFIEHANFQSKEASGSADIEPTEPHPSGIRY